MNPVYHYIDSLGDLIVTVPLEALLGKTSDACLTANNKDLLGADDVIDIPVDLKFSAIYSTDSRKSIVVLECKHHDYESLHVTTITSIWNSQIKMSPAFLSSVFSINELLRAVDHVNQMKRL